MRYFRKLNYAIDLGWGREEIYPVNPSDLAVRYTLNGWYRENPSYDPADPDWVDQWEQIQDEQLDPDVMVCEEPGGELLPISEVGNMDLVWCYWDGHNHKEITLNLPNGDWEEVEFVPPQTDKVIDLRTRQYHIGEDWVFVESFMQGDQDFWIKRNVFEDLKDWDQL